MKEENDQDEQKVPNYRGGLYYHKPTIRINKDLVQKTQERMNEVMEHRKRRWDITNPDYDPSLPKPIMFDLEKDDFVRDPKNNPPINYGEKMTEELRLNKEYLDAVDKLEDNIKPFLPKEGRQFQPNDNLLICWKCKCLNLVHPSWEYIECSDCRSLCKVPNFKSPSTPQNRSHTNKRVPCVFSILICPKCKHENKCLVSNETMTCTACLEKFEIIQPDENPPEIDCDSLDPNSRYYKFKHKTPAPYPPPGTIGVCDLFFPDPVNVNWYSYNQLNDVTHQMVNAYRRETKRRALIDRVKKEYFGKNKLTDPDKVYLRDKLKEIDRKVTYAIKHNYNNGMYYKPYKLEESYLESQKGVLNKLNNEKTKCYEELFFMNGRKNV